MGGHLLVIPYPATGHMNPIIDLTGQLALRGGLAITIAVTNLNITILKSLLTKHPELQTLTLDFPTHPSIPPDVEHLAQLGNQSNLHFISALYRLYDPILQWALSTTPRPTAILSDFFLGWSVSLASQLRIPRYAFYSSGAFFCSVFDRLWLNLDTLQSKFPASITFHDLPGSPTFQQQHLPSVFRRYVQSDPDSSIMRLSMEANPFSHAVVINTFQSAEPDHLEFLKRTGFSNGRVYSVGPISVTSHVDSSSGAFEQKVWLDGCPDGSVLYVCFGSQKAISPDQTNAIAEGLEASGVRFLWVVRQRSVPDGYEERVKGRGVLINGWASQTDILGHRAVGGFLSHCGWNSVLEGITGGAVILCWPMEAEQFLNAWLVVEYMGIGVPVCEGTDTVPDPAELGRKILEFFETDMPQKARAKDMSEAALKAVRNGGSSYVDLDELAKELRGLGGLNIQDLHNKSSE